MCFALVLILTVPAAFEPVRNVQKVSFFLTAQFFYLIIGVPLIGPRSSCTHFCPVGFEVQYLTKLKLLFFTAQKPVMPKEQSFARREQ